MRRLGDRFLDAFLTAIRGPLWLYFRLFYGLVVEGREHMPRRGPVVLAPNHQSHYDGIVAGFLLPCPVYFLVNGFYYDRPVVGWLLRRLRGIPVYGPRDREGFARIVERLTEGNAVTIFPEGTRSPDGAVHRLKHGAARAALAVGADIVPVSIRGAFEAWPRHRRLPRFCHPVRLEYHPPIRCERAERQDLRRRVLEVTAELEGVLRPPVAAWQRLMRRKALEGGKSGDGSQEGARA